MNFEIAPKETEVLLTWDDARLYCFALNVDGKTGWRLPTKDELNEIYESRNDFEKRDYWSYTENDDSGIWVQNFMYGFQATGHKSGGRNYVRAIRDLKDNQTLHSRLNRYITHLLTNRSK